MTLEITETEPAMKGQTASGSFKPAMLSNGVRTMVPTHIVPGTRVVVMTADGSYVERAKDLTTPARSRALPSETDRRASAAAR